MRKVGRMLAMVGVAMMLAGMVGCSSGPATVADSGIRGLPAEARLIGGGVSGQVQIPQNGLLYLVEARDQKVVDTRLVRAGEPVVLEADDVVEAVYISRYGAAADEVAAHTREAISTLDREALADLEVNVLYFFASLESLGLEGLAEEMSTESAE